MQTTIEQAQQLLSAKGACREARLWLATQPDVTTAWETCERPDWMLWIAARLGIDRRVVVRAACACARTALVYVPAGEKRPLRAIETAERWARGEATDEEVRAVSAAADAADAAYAAYAAYAAAAYAAADAAADAADARGKAQRHMAAVVREHITLAMLREVA